MKKQADRQVNKQRNRQINKQIEKQTRLIYSIGLAILFALSCSSGGGSSSAATTPAPTITATAVAQSAVGAVLVTWTEPTNADFLGVSITYTVAGGTAATPVRVAKGTTTRTFTGLTGGAAYTFTVSAINGSGTLAAGTVSTTTVATATATAPTITVTAVAQSAAASVNLTWTEPTNADFLGVSITYTIAGGTASTPVRVAKGTTTQTFTGLIGSAAYTFTVSAVNGTGALAVGTVSTTNVVTAMATTPAVLAVRAIPLNVLGSVQATWSEPADANFLGVSITQTLASTTSAAVRVAKGTTTHTFTGLTRGSTYTITVSAVNGSGTLAAGTVSATNVVTTMATPTNFIALFSLGQQDGDFGFAACQTAIDNNAVTPNLRSRGYSVARFFGSTPTYDFLNIATDAQALATTEGTAITGNLAVFTNNTGTTAPITTFGATGSEAPVTLANMLAVSGSLGMFQNGGQNVLTHLGIGTTAAQRFWTFSNNGAYLSSASCAGATSNLSTPPPGINGSNIALIYAPSSTPSCINTRHVLCIAR